MASDKLARRMAGGALVALAALMLQARPAFAQG